MLLETADRCKLVLIPSTDAAPQLKKVQQLASQVESATGVAPGWLLSCGSFKVVLACDASRRVRGLLVAEVISRAYPVALPTPAEAAKPEASAAAVAAASSDGPHAPRGSLQAAGSTPPPVHEPPAPPASQQHLRVAAAAADQPPELQALPQKPVKAACGVRMVWVAPMHRRRRLASQLLDAARYHLIPGYVVPRHQVAFSYPTEEGRRLASAYGSSSNGIGGSSSSGSGVGSSCYLVYSPLVTTNGINGR